MKPTAIRSTEDFITAVRQDSDDRDEGSPIWFRGEPGDIETPLIPKLYRFRADGTLRDENKLLQLFRMKAPVLGAVPDRKATDQWLFLAQHMGLPT
jgi:hypothetical protein